MLCFLADDIGGTTGSGVSTLGVEEVELLAVGFEVGAGEDFGFEVDFAAARGVDSATALDVVFAFDALVFVPSVFFACVAVLASFSAAAVAFAVVFFVLDGALALGALVAGAATAVSFKASFIACAFFGLVVETCRTLWLSGPAMIVPIGETAELALSQVHPHLDSICVLSPKRDILFRTRYVGMTDIVLCNDLEDCQTGQSRIFVMIQNSQVSDRSVSQATISSVESSSGLHGTDADPWQDGSITCIGSQNGWLPVTLEDRDALFGKLLVHALSTVSSWTRP